MRTQDLVHALYGHEVPEKVVSQDFVVETSFLHRVFDEMLGGGFA